MACCATSMGCRPYRGTTEVPNSVRCGASAPTQASATMGWTAIAWETQRLSNPDASAKRAAARTSSTVARVVPPARPHRTPNRSLANVCSLLPCVLLQTLPLICYNSREVLNSNHSLYHTPVCRAVQGHARAEVMERHTCTHHAEHSETARHTIHQKEHRMSDVTILATELGFPEGPVVCPDGSVVLTDIRHGRCTRVFPDGSTRVFSHTGGGPNGLAIGPDGAFYLCNNGEIGRAHV